MVKYNVKIKIGNKVYKQIGETISEALEQFDIEKVAGKCILNVSKGKKTAEMFLFPRQVRKLKISKVLRNVLDKRLNTALL